jgi:manganese/zinc/iron transport system substrate-binding protein
MKLLLLSAVALGLHVIAAKAQLEIVCTTGMVGDLVQNISGERGRVTTLMREGIDPHLFKPTRDDVARLMKADVIFLNGLQLEGRMVETFKTLEKRGKTVTPVTAAIPSEKLLLEGNEPDPHVWMDPALWSYGIETVRETLTRLDPEGADYYKTNAQRYAATLAGLSEKVRELISSIPKEQRVLVTAHDAFAYFTKTTGLENVAIQGLNTEAEAGVGDINRIVDLIVNRRIPAVFAESSVSDRNIRAVIEGASARGWNVKMGQTLYSDSLGPAGSPAGTVVGMIEQNTLAISSALGGEK